MGEDFIQEAEKLASSKYVLAGVAVVALVGGYFFISSQLANIASAGATDSTSAGVLPSTVGVSPLSAVGASSDGGGSGSSTIDPTALVQMETAMSGNNLQLGLAQLTAQTTAAQLNAQVSIAGLQASEQTNIAQTIASTFATLFAKRPTAATNFNGSINIGGTPISFSLNNTALGFGDISNPKSGLSALTNMELGQNAQIAGATFSPVSVAGASGPGAVSVSAGGASIGGVGSVVAGSRSANLA